MSRRHGTPFVMAGLDPAIHAFPAKGVDGPVKPGHDEEARTKLNPLLCSTPFVMAGLDPAIHAFPAKGVDGPVKPGYDEEARTKLNPLLCSTPFVMAGLDPAIHAFPAKGVNGPVKPGYDEEARTKLNPLLCSVERSRFFVPAALSHAPRGARVKGARSAARSALPLTRALRGASLGPPGIRRPIP